MVYPGEVPSMGVRDINAASKDACEIVPVDLYREIQGQGRANSESGGFGQEALSLYEPDTSNKLAIQYIEC